MISIVICLIFAVSAFADKCKEHLHDSYNLCLINSNQSDYKFLHKCVKMVSNDFLQECANECIFDYKSCLEISNSNSDLVICNYQLTTCDTEVNNHTTKIFRVCFMLIILGIGILIVSHNAYESYRLHNSYSHIV